MSAVMTFAVIGCTKEDADGDNRNGNTDSTAVVIPDEANVVIIDDVTYPIDVEMIDAMNFRASDTANARFDLIGGVQRIDLSGTLQETYDITKPIAGIHAGFRFSSREFFSLVYDNTGEKVMGHLDSKEYDGESMFKQGTATVLFDGKKIYVKLYGTLDNDHTFGFVVTLPLGGSTPEPEPGPQEELDRLVINGENITMNGSLSIANDGILLFNLYEASGEKDLNFSLDITKEALGYFINLGNLNSLMYYSLSFTSDDRQIGQQCSDDDDYAELNWESLDSAAFEDETLLYVTLENDKYVLQINGKLKDGTTFDLRHTIPVNAIKAMEGQIVIDGEVFYAVAQMNSRSVTGQNGIDSIYHVTVNGYTSKEAAYAGAPANNQIEITYDNRMFDNIIALDESSTKDYSISCNDDNANFSQSSNNGTMSASIDDGATSTRPVFKSGNFYVNNNMQSYSVAIHGILTNNHAISVSVHILK